MINLYLDSSSVVKVYHREPETEKVLNILAKDINEIYISEIAKVEFISAIWKKIRQGEFIEEEGKEIIKNFEDDYFKYQWVKVNIETLNSAKELIKKYGTDGLRTLDAIQLACAVYVKEKIDEYLTFDKNLKEIFVKEGLNII